MAIYLKSFFIHMEQHTKQVRQNQMTPSDAKKTNEGNPKEEKKKENVMCTITITSTRKGQRKKNRVLSKANKCK